MKTTHVFSALMVSDLDRATAWYATLIGRAPDIVPNDREVMWQLAATSNLYLLADLIVQTMVATVPELLDADDEGPEAVERVARDARRKLLLIVLGIPHWSP